MSGAPKEKKKVLLCTIREKIKDGSPNKRCTSTEPSIYGPFTNQVNQELRLLFEEWKTLRKNANLPTTQRFLYWIVGMLKRINFIAGDIDGLVQKEKNKKGVKEWAKGADREINDLRNKLEEVKKILYEERQAAKEADNLARFEEGRHLSYREKEVGPETRRMVISASTNETKLDAPGASSAGPAPLITPSHSLVIFIGLVTPHSSTYVFIQT